MIDSLLVEQRLGGTRSVLDACLTPGFAMSGKPIVRIGSVVPTPAEHEKIRKELEDSQKVKRSKMQCMKQWLETHGDAGGVNKEVYESKGNSRMAYLEQWMVFNNRQKEAQKERKISKQIYADKQRTGIVYEWGSEQMDLKLGPMRAQGLRDSEKLDWDPCPITGSDKDPYRIWKVPQHFVKTIAGEKGSTEVQNTGEATERDLKLMEGIENPMTDPEEPASSSMVKQEQFTEEQKEELEAKELETNPKPKLHVYQDMVTEMERCQALADKHPYGEKLAKDLAVHVKQLKKIEAILKNLVIGKKDPKPEGMVQLLRISKDTEEKCVEFKEWCKKFGIVEAKKRRKS